jgi:hypothetical protein
VPNLAPHKLSEIPSLLNLLAAWSRDLTCAKFATSVSILKKKPLVSLALKLKEIIAKKAKESYKTNVGRPSKSRQKSDKISRLNTIARRAKGIKSYRKVEREKVVRNLTKCLN